jgi:hypothetical protein
MFNYVTCSGKEQNQFVWSISHSPAQIKEMGDLFIML